MKIMPDLNGLAIRENGFNSGRVFAHCRCDPVAVGVSMERGDTPYDWDNRNRNEGCLFQYTLRGQGWFQTLPEGKAEPLAPGTGFLTELPSQTRYWLEPGDEWGFIYVILDGDLARERVRELLDRHGALWTLPESHASVSALRDLHLRVCDGRIPDAFELSSIAHTFLMDLFRSGPRPERRRSVYVEAAMRHMAQAYGDAALSMAEIEEAAGCSRYHLSRLFRTELGVSPYAYLQEVRIRAALGWLHHSDKPVKEIAGLCGYADTANFCREFKRQTHKTPTRARRLGRNLNLSAVHTP